MGPTWVLILLAAVPRLLESPRWAMGARDGPLALDHVIVGRLERTRDNMKENVVLFVLF